MSRKRTWIEWGTWRCTSCDQEISGKHNKCPTCGNSREQDELDKVSFEKVEVVTKPEEREVALSGADWHCPRCGSGNLGTEEVGALDRTYRTGSYRVDFRYDEGGETFFTFKNPQTESEFRSWDLGMPAVVDTHHLALEKGNP